MNGSGVATTVWVQPDNALYHVYANRATVGPAGAGSALPTVTLSAAPASITPKMAAAIDFAMRDLGGGAAGRKQSTKADPDLLLATYDPIMWQ